jgi:hypothetical protein
MITPRSFKPYHCCFGRFQGCLESPVDCHSGEWIEVIGKGGKEKRSTRFACSVALGLSNNQALEVRIWNEELRFDWREPSSSSFSWNHLFVSGCKRDSSGRPGRSSATFKNIFTSENILKSSVEMKF